MLHSWSDMAEDSARIYFSEGVAKSVMSAKNKLTPSHTRGAPAMMYLVNRI